MSSADPKKRSGGNNKSTVSYAARLHRIHAGAAATRVEFSRPLDITWRGEGGEGDAKQAIAFRLATCWNVCEGIPTKLLLDGILRDVFCAVEAGDLPTAQALVATLDRGTDRTNGRLHDCPGCLQGGAGDDALDGEGDELTEAL